MSNTRPLLVDSSPHVAEPVDELADLREELESLRKDFNELQSGLERDRNELGRMLHSLRAVFGSGSTEAGSPPTAASLSQPPNPIAWQAWKQQLPAPCGRIIDALLVQPLTQTQMRAFCKMHPSNISVALKTLRANGLLEQDGKLWRLRRI